MAAPPVEPSMDDLAAQVGAGDDLKRYLRVRGTTSAGAFAIVAQSQDQFDAFIVAPLIAGWQPDPSVDAITVPEPERPIARAILRFMWTFSQGSQSSRCFVITPGDCITGSVAFRIHTFAIDGS